LFKLRTSNQILITIIENRIVMKVAIHGFI
jgi:hypothetical protein